MKYSAIFAELKGYFGMHSTIRLDEGARAPSEVRRIGINLTTNWKSPLRRDWFDRPNIEVKINLVNVPLMTQQ